MTLSGHLGRLIQIRTSEPPSHCECWIRTTVHVRLSMVTMGAPPSMPGHRAHAVGPQCVQLAHRTVERHRLDVGVTGKQQMRAHRLEECRALLARVRLRQQRGERMRLARGITLVSEPGDRRRTLCHQVHCPMHDGVGEIALAGQRRIVARRPARGRRSRWRRATPPARLWSGARRTRL
jgi:hypothetical protein